MFDGGSFVFLENNFFAWEGPPSGDDDSLRWPLDAPS